MIFEYDPDKSSSNLQKHGIDFERAQLLWGDPNALEIQAKSDSESPICAYRQDRRQNLDRVLYLSR
ncbi:MAG: BrnT family toxin [Sulfuricurvum sp.]|uniref:BrnT family toxin n=1 Tax=Sulfuricurvum sp. TaxID=2025608 RepID=UPI003D0D0F1D